MNDNKNNENTALLANNNNNDDDESSLSSATIFVEKVVPKGNVWLCYFTVFLSCVSFSVVIPSLWPYLKNLGGSKSDIGYPIAIFSLGSILGSSILGRLANVWTFKSCLVIALFANFISAAFYTQLSTFQLDPTNAIILMCVIRFVSGISAGSTAVVLAYLAEVTEGQQQVSAIANAELVISLSFLLGPALGAVFSLIDLGYKRFRVDGTTLPGYFGAITAFLGAIAVLLLFETLPQEKVYRGSNIDKHSSPKLAQQRSILLAVMIVSQFFLDSCVAVYDTISVPIMQQYYDFTILDTSITWASIGLLSACAILTFKWLSKRFATHKLLLCSFLLLTIGFLIMTDIQFTHQSKPSTLPLYRFLIGTAFVCTSFPSANIGLGSTYAGVIGATEQGAWLGALRASGGLARLVGPLSASWLFDHDLTAYCFGSVAIGLALALAVMSVCSRQMGIVVEAQKPPGERKHVISQQQQQQQQDNYNIQDSFRQFQSIEKDLPSTPNSSFKLKTKIKK